MKTMDRQSCCLIIWAITLITSSAFVFENRFDSSVLDFIPCNIDNSNQWTSRVDQSLKQNLNETLTLHGSSRRKRAVLEWPIATGVNRPSQLVADFYINVPIYSPLPPNKLFMPISIQGKYTMVLPDVEFNIFDGKSMEEKFTIYTLLENFLSSLGFDGPTCLLRTLCERSEYHVLVDGIVGEVVTLLLDLGSHTGNHTYQDYVEAQEIGRTLGDCHFKYSGCPFSIFKWIDT